MISLDLSKEWKKGNLKFWPGRVVMTNGLQQELLAMPIQFNEKVQGLLMRHLQGDWGHIEEEDIPVNREAVEHGGMIHGIYDIRGSVIWVITHWHPNDMHMTYTTFLKPEEYQSLSR